MKMAMTMTLASLEDIGAVPHAIPAARFNAMVSEETERWKRMVEKMNAKERY